jgi:excisionase family DNA binding protein
VPRNKNNSVEFVRTEFLTIDQFKKQIIPWSTSTIRRRILNEGLPAIKDGSGWLFKRSDVQEWFKRREHRAG